MVRTGVEHAVLAGGCCTRLVCNPDSPAPTPHRSRSLTREIVALVDREADLLNRRGCWVLGAELGAAAAAALLHGPHTNAAAPTCRRCTYCRGRDADSLAGLRQRLANLFLEFALGGGGGAAATAARGGRVAAVQTA